MAGALTANAVDVRLDGATVQETTTVIADVSMLSPVDGANNVLLTAIVLLTETDAGTELTFQWQRAGIGGQLDEDSLGAAIGDPFVIESGDSELDGPLVVVQAVDRGAGLTSGYALTVVAETESVTEAEALNADAVLYD